jgi:two-component system response regulator AtoC
VRFISATNRDLAGEVQRGTFRQDLYFRLNGIALSIPPLRERSEEIEPLARAFATSAAASIGRSPPIITSHAMAALMNHDWPGNVRELRNAIERAVVLCDGVIRPEDFVLDAHATAGMQTPMAVSTVAFRKAALERPPELGEGPSAPARDNVQTQPIGNLRQELGSLERQRMIDALEKCAGNQTSAAAMLGIPRRTFVAKLAAYNIPRPRKKV